MNKAFAYWLLICYSVILLKPAMPCLRDIVAHTLWRYEHISSVHFENGKYHTHYESLGAAQKNNPGKASHSYNNETNSGEHFFAAEPYHFLPRPIIPSIVYPNFSVPILSSCLSCNYPPPKAA